MAGGVLCCRDAADWHSQYISDEGSVWLDQHWHRHLSVTLGRFASCFSSPATISVEGVLQDKIPLRSQDGQLEVFHKPWFGTFNMLFAVVQAFSRSEGESLVTRPCPTQRYFRLCRW